MREVKEPDELKLMRKAIGYTAAGHGRILETLKPGMREFELKDLIEDAFRKAGSRHLAYDSIVGSGPNGAVLHYPKDDRAMKDGEVVVVDAGAEAEYYATDVTRTYPVSGKFSPEQREIYDIVLKAQAAGIAAAKAGVTQRTLEKAVRKVIDDAGLPRRVHPRLLSLRGPGGARRRRLRRPAPGRRGAHRRAGHLPATAGLRGADRGRDPHHPHRRRGADPGDSQGPGRDRAADAEPLAAALSNHGSRAGGGSPAMRLQPIMLTGCNRLLDSPDRRAGWGS